MDDKDTIKQIRGMAAKYGWIEIDDQKNIMMISFLKDQDRINIYYSKPWRMTIATTVNHPLAGRHQLFRKYVRMNELETIFQLPRRHTGKGYFRKN
jgi:hypothetical protein